jgi:hypothetical protein
LSPGSSYAGKATDGLDIGANIDQLDAAQGTIANVNITNSTGSAAVTFTTPDVGNSCWVAYGQKGAALSTYTLSGVDTSQTVQRSIPIVPSTSIAILCSGTVAQLY